MNLSIYRHSGKIGYAPLVFVLVGVPLLIILSCVYAYLMLYNPFIYISFFILVGYVIAVGMVAPLTATFGNCRNKMFITLTGFISGLLGLYFAWAFFLYALMQRFGKVKTGLLDIALSPSVMWFLVEQLNYTGWFNIQSATPSGILLWIFWGIEALAIVLAAVIGSTFAINDQMFCEKCGVWCDVKNTKYLKIPPALAGTPASKIDPLTLDSLENIDSALTPYIKAELLECKKCVDFKGIRFKVVSSTIDGNGKEKMHLDDIPGIVLMT